MTGTLNCTITVTRAKRGGHAGLEGVRSPVRTCWGIGGVNAEFPGSGELVSPSSLRAHTYM